MTETTGDIWAPGWDSAAAQGYHVWRVVPANGDVNAKGLAVMGRGVARDAAARFPNLRRELADRLQKHGNKVFLFPEYGIVTFPVKTHWIDKARPDLIRKSAQELLKLHEVIEGRKKRFIIMPRVGCGNGRLDWAETVRPIIEEELGECAELVVVEVPEE